MTEAVKHTPGPWHAEHERGPKNRHATASTGVWSQQKFDAALDAGDTYEPMDGAWICGIWGELSPEDFANARLIAAAPELIDLVREMIPFLEDIARQRHPAWRPEMADRDSVLGRAYSVIAKAEGRS